MTVVPSHVDRNLGGTMSTNEQADANGSEARSAEREGDSKRAMSPRLLKRLGEAAMGWPRSYGEQYWICRYKRDPQTRSYDIDGAFHTETEAIDAIAGREGFGVFGPYTPELGEELRPNLPSSLNVEKVYVKVEGVADLIEVDERFDALFWSPAAIEKFVFPYYCGAEGLDYTVRVRDEYVNRDAYLMAHSDDTEYTLWGASKRQGQAPRLEPLKSSR